jgi:pimeloyl-ACP methyl ester carboxylesterase
MSIVEPFTRFQPPGQRIDIGGHCLYLHGMGVKRPGQSTVILEAGHSDWSHCWPKVQPEIAHFARVIAYDRAGFGWSDAGPRPRTPLRLVTELHELLACAGETGPYIFVGHSLGAALGRLFTSLYPSEVVGMVWVDSAHERMQQYIPFWNAAYYGLVASGYLGSALARAGLVHRFGRGLMLANTPLAQTPEEQDALVAQMGAPCFFETIRDETRGWLPPENWEHHSGTHAQSPGAHSLSHGELGDLPVTMIEAQYPPEPPRGYPPRQWREFRAGWKKIQDDLSGLSTRTRRVPVTSGHNVMYERPEVIIQAVRDLFDQLS